jgi:hypothetical protein
MRRKLLAGFSKACGCHVLYRVSVVGPPSRERFTGTSLAHDPAARLPTLLLLGDYGRGSVLWAGLYVVQQNLRFVHLQEKQKSISGKIITRGFCCCDSLE